MPQISTGSDFFVKTGNTFADRFIRDIGKQNFTTKGRSPVGPVAFREGVRGAQEADVDLASQLAGISANRALAEERIAVDRERIGTSRDLNLKNMRRQEKQFKQQMFSNAIRSGIGLLFTPIPQKSTTMAGKIAGTAGAQKIGGGIKKIFKKLGIL